MPVANAFSALVDALITLRLVALSFIGSLLVSIGGAASHIVRLANGSSLSCLAINGSSSLTVPLLSVRALSLAASLRACQTLTSLTLFAVGLWSGASPACGNAIVASLVGHPTLRALDLGSNHVSGKHRDAVCARLFAANTPALSTLLVSGCSMGDKGLLPLFCALLGNTFLRELDCSYNYGGVCDKAPRSASHVLDDVTANSTLTALRLST